MIRPTRRFGLAAALTAGAAVIIGCQSPKSTTTNASNVSMGAINDKCPASGKSVSADAGTSAWRGHRIGFCCPACVAPWESMSAKDKDSFIAQYSQP